MTNVQKIIRICAIAFAIFLIISIIGGALSVLGLFSVFSDDATLENYTELEINRASAVRSLDIEISAANLTITTGESLKLETNNKYVRCSVDNGVLKIFERANGVKINGNVSSGVKLQIPEGFEFDKLEISSGAGNVEASSLFAREMSFELGAGNVTVTALSVSGSAEIEGGAGNFDLKSGTINNLDFDLGVGDTDITLTLTGKSEINMGVGDLDVNLLGGKESYKINVNKGLGSVNVDSQSMSDGDSFGNGSSLIDIDGGVGNIDVKFK